MINNIKQRQKSDGDILKQLYIKISVINLRHQWTWAIGSTIFFMAGALTIKLVLFCAMFVATLKTRLRIYLGTWWECKSPIPLVIFSVNVCRIVYNFPSINYDQHSHTSCSFSNSRKSLGTSWQKQSHSMKPSSGQARRLFFAHCSLRIVISLSFPWV